MTNTFFELDARANRQDKERKNSRKSYIVMAAGTALCLGLLPLWRYFFPDAFTWFAVGTLILAITLAIGAALIFKPSYDPMWQASSKASMLRVFALLGSFALLQFFRPETLLPVILQSLLVTVFFFTASMVITPRMK